MTLRPSPGKPLPNITLSTLDGRQITIGTASDGFEWQMLIVYRGKHCPICTRYLGELNDLLSQYHDLGVEVIAASADPLDKVQAHLGDLNLSYPVGYGLSIEQMRALGLYISQPRSPQETDAPFAEPGLFVVNAEGLLQVVDIANAPFARPPLANLVQGLGFIKNPENKYPIRGTHD